MLAKRRGERVLALTAAAASEAESASVLVQRCVATRTPPVTPASFAAKISGMSFSHPRDDMPLVEALYAAGFSERLAQVTKLDYTNLRWGDAEAEAVAAVLSSGAATSLKSLDLGANAISDKGANALTASLEGAPALSFLNLLGNRAIGEAAAAKLREACNERGIKVYV